MFVRIVKMSFNPLKINEFLSNFEAQKKEIRGFEGCELLELYRDKHNTNVFFTYSYWHTEADLENYRHSDLFKGIWANTKPMFNAKPEAWSVDKLSSLT
jgi:heme-degrading monooxygenase HmoA